MTTRDELEERQRVRLEKMDASYQAVRDLVIEKNAAELDSLGSAWVQTRFGDHPIWRWRRWEIHGSVNASWCTLWVAGYERREKFYSFSPLDGAGRPSVAECMELAQQLQDVLDQKEQK